MWLLSHDRSRRLQAFVIFVSVCILMCLYFCLIISFCGVCLCVVFVVRCMHSSACMYMYVCDKYFAFVCVVYNTILVNKMPTLHYSDIGRKF